MPTEIWGGRSAGAGGVFAAAAGTRVSAQFDATNDDTPGLVTGLAVPVVMRDGYSYMLQAHLVVAADLVGGWQVGFASANGFVTRTLSIRAEDNAGAGGGATQLLSAPTTAGGIGTASLTVWIDGMVDISGGDVAAGAVGLEFAQNTATAGTTSSVMPGSYMLLKEIP